MSAVAEPGGASSLERLTDLGGAAPTGLAAPGDAAPAPRARPATAVAAQPVPQAPEARSPERPAQSRMALLSSAAIVNQARDGDGTPPRPRYDPAPLAGQPRLRMVRLTTVPAKLTPIERLRALAVD